MLFFSIRFPKNREIAEQWNIALGIEPEKYAYGFVCCEHFEDQHFKRKNKTELKTDAVPTIVQNKQNSSIEEHHCNSNDEMIAVFEAVALTDSMKSIEPISINAESSSALGTLSLFLNNLHKSNEFCSLHSLDFTLIVDICIGNAIDATGHSSNCALIEEAMEAEASVSFGNLNSRACERCNWKDQLIEERDDQIRQLRRELKKAKHKIWSIETTKRKLNNAFAELKQRHLLDEKYSQMLEVLSY